MKINNVAVARTITPNDVYAIYQTADGCVWLDLDPDMDDARVSLMGTLPLDASDDDMVAACRVQYTADSVRS